MEASRGGTILVGRSSVQRGTSGGHRAELPGDGLPAGRQRLERDQMVRAAPHDRECCRGPDGRPPRAGSLPQRDWVLARLAATPDLTLRGLVAELAERGVSASYGSVWRLLAAEGLTFKKSLHVAEQTRPDVARRRALAAASGAHRPETVDVRRRDVDQDQHHPRAWPPIPAHPRA